MHYVSTRGMSPPVSASEALLSGIAPDGGLYLPDELPDLSPLLSQRLPYPLLAAEVFTALMPDFTRGELEGAAGDAYAGAFDTPEVTPLVSVNGIRFLELFHGPTGSFKDVALQALPRLMALARDRLDSQTEYLVLTATSGDTGSAAMQGFRGVPGFRVLVYYPRDGVSPVQRLQMTAMAGDNVQAVGVKGNFDDAQAGVKAVFARGGEGLPNRMRLSSANSINIGRLIPQVVYYVYACRELLLRGEARPGERIDFIVPSGNFGDALAGYLAKQMGMPIRRIVCASNFNSVLTDFLRTGFFDSRRPLYQTLSPSMDILIPSNLERLLYLVSARDAGEVRRMMEVHRRNGCFTVGEDAMRLIRETFTGYSATDAQTLDGIRIMWEANRYLMDPHTSAAHHALSMLPALPHLCVTLATASPFKFPRTVCRALGMSLTEDESRLPGQLARKIRRPLPAFLRNLARRREVHQDVIQKEDLSADVLRRASSW